MRRFFLMGTVALWSVAAMAAESGEVAVTMSDGAQKCDTCESKAVRLEQAKDRLNFFECLEPGSKCRYWSGEVARAGRCKTVQVTATVRRQTVRGTDCACVLPEIGQQAAAFLPN